MEDFEHLLVCPHCGFILEYVSDTETEEGINTLFYCINEECNTIVTVEHYYKEV